MNRGEERTEEESEERRERGEERGERSGEEERGEERRREGGRREDDGELYLLLNSPCRGQKLLFNNQEKFHRSMPPSRVLKAAGDCCPSTGTNRGLGLSGSTTNQTPITTIAGAASRGAQRRHVLIKLHV